MIPFPSRYRLLRKLRAASKEEQRLRPFARAYEAARAAHLAAWDAVYLPNGKPRPHKP